MLENPVEVAADVHDPRAKSTGDTLDHHLQAFAAGDLGAILTDYTNE